MRLLLALLLMFPLLTEAAVRRLSECGTLPATISEAEPFDLDACSLANGDDITSLLTDIRTEWPTGFYVRAPSQTVSVISDYIAWPTATKTYVFLEDQSAANKLTIQHKTSPGNFYVMWGFSNFTTVKIGGSNLSITFKGNHPGLANCTQHPNYASDPLCDWAANYGLLDFRVSDGSLAQLVDVRANVQFSQQYAIYTLGAECAASACGTPNHIQQLNVAGVFYATSGVFFHHGVINAWSDPDRTVVVDPYVRGTGWDGTLSSATQDGLPIGCISFADKQSRAASVIGYNFATLTGGVSLQYGSGGFIPRNPGTIGSASAPFVIRMKDVGVTGPGTAYQAGVRPKNPGEAILFKGDPANDTGTTPSRYLRVVKQPDTYGSGAASAPATGCAYNPGDGGLSELFRFENNSGGSTEGYHLHLTGDWRTASGGGTWTRGPLATLGMNDSNTTYPVRKIQFRVASGTTIADTMTIKDQTTLYGPGTWANVSVEDASAVVQGQSSVVRDTNVSGTVTLASGTESTTISNVRFTGTARAVITNSGATGTVITNLCVPDGSSIAGSGTVLYQGVSQSLPYIIPNGTQNCSITADGKPNKPTGGSVN
jgi:hypothetical protein